MQKIVEFISKNQSKFVLLLLVVVILDFLSKFSYFNVVLLFPYPLNTTIIIWVVTAILFRLDERFSFGTALVLLCIVMIVSMFWRSSLIEALGNSVYGLLLLGTVQTIVHNVVRSKV